MKRTVMQAGVLASVTAGKAAPIRLKCMLATQNVATSRSGAGLLLNISDDVIFSSNTCMIVDVMNPLSFA